MENMSSHDAICNNCPVVNVNDTVRDAIGQMRKYKAVTVFVLDDDDKLVGIFNMRTLIKKLLPKSVTMEHGLTNLGFVEDAKMASVKKFIKNQDTPVKDVLTTDHLVVYPDTPFMEGLQILMQEGRSVAIVERETHKFMGRITMWSLLDALEEGAKKGL